MKEKIILIVSLCVGVVALLLTAQFFKSKDAEFQKKLAELYRGAKRIEVVLAANDIPSGTVITQSDLVKADRIKSHLRANTVIVKDAHLILGHKTVFKIKAKDPILWTDIEESARSTKGLSSIVMPGMRAISLSVGGAAAVSGMLQPNDRIDLLGTFSFPSKTVAGEMETVTLTVLQDVTILATGQTMAKQESLRQRINSRQTSGYNTVTLQVTPEEAEILVFAQKMRGSLTLTLRNPNDNTWKRDLPEVNFKHLQFELPKLNEERQRKIRHKKGV